MKDLILLHGALGSSSSLMGLQQSLSAHYHCHLLNLSGHGQKAFDPEGFGIEYFAHELEEYISSNKLHQADIFGYSMGGYVALYLASQKPDLLGKIITLGTKFGWSAESADRETSRLNPELMEEKIPAYTAKLKETHGEQWKELVWQTAGMMIELGESPLLDIEALGQIQSPVLVMRGSKDQMVNHVESKWAVAHLALGQFKELQDQSHPIDQVDIEVLAEQILHF